MTEWRPEGWKNPYSGVEFADWAESLWEAGADAMMAGLMKHLRDAADRNLELAQSAIYNDSLAFPRISNQLTRDSTAFLIVADYIEYDRLRLIGKDPYPAISDEKDG